MGLTKEKVCDFMNMYEVKRKMLYIMPVDNIKSVKIKNIEGYDLDKPKETLDNLLTIKNIYDRRNIKSEELELEISNFKMKIREKRLSIILDKNGVQ